MFDNLFWALYWIDVLSELPKQMFGGILFGILAAGSVGIVRHGIMGLDEVLWKVFLFPFIIVFTFFVSAAFIPSKQTMYMMLGVQATKDFTQTEMGKKLEVYINSQMDDFLKKKSN